MKKIMLLLCAALFTSQAFSQTKIGIKGGVNFANITDNSGGGTNSNNVLTTFNIGGYLDLPIAVGFALQPGIMLEGKGEKIHYSSTALDADYTIKVKPLYLEIPVNFVGKIPLSANSHFLLGFGPYVAFGIGGTVKTHGNFGGSTTDGSSDIQWDDDTPFNNGDKNQGYDKLKRFDYGANFLAGFQMGAVTLTANYGLGMAKINSGSDNDDNNKNKNRVFGVSLGFLFGTK